MQRVGKLLGIMFVVGIVFFVIFAEKKDSNDIDSYKENNVEDYQNSYIYKDVDIIQLYGGLKDSSGLKKSLKNEKSDESKSNVKKVGKNVSGNSVSVSEMLISYKDRKYDVDLDTEIQLEKAGFLSDDINKGDEDVTSSIIDENLINNQIINNRDETKLYTGKISTLNLSKSVKIKNNESNYTDYVKEIDNVESEFLYPDADYLENHNITIKKYISKYSGLNMKKLYKKDKSDFDSNVDASTLYKYSATPFSLSLSYTESGKHKFDMEQATGSDLLPDLGLSDDVINQLLVNEEIDVKSIESKNDEFLQKVFQETRDPDVLNTILKTYISEYQFSKAKKYIENLPEMYREQIEPGLNLMISFNSFSLSSKTIKDQLTSLVKGYSDLGKISQEDALWYQGVILLMHKEYDKFFELAGSFSLDDHKKLASKLQGYQEQIKNQKGMPEYYFDTLVSLELFNNGFFQPAKVIALTSLQKNSNYILPYQVLAYANFLTNSWDTSAEYLKKLIELDPNNAEKYRFLMGVAHYWNEKYEQSVVMLSLIRDSKLHLDAQRYLINDYLQLRQNNKLISIWNKLLGSENLVDSDFYTYFYEAFYHPYSEGRDFELYMLDTDLANKMQHLCNLKLASDEKVVCTYGTIGKNIANGQFEGIEKMLLNLVSEYPQGYLYKALGEYYIKQGDIERAKAYLIKAIYSTQKKSEIVQIKALLQNVIG